MLESGVESTLESDLESRLESRLNDLRSGIAASCGPHKARKMHYLNVISMRVVRLFLSVAGSLRLKSVHKTNHHLFVIEDKLHNMHKN